MSEAFNLFFTIWIFAVGLCIGSFLNVVALRGLSGESIVFPSSKCPKCQNKLQWWMNIPVISYILLRGKCFYCKEHISIQYPIVEFLTGVLFLLIYQKFAISFEMLFFLIAVSILIVMTLTDLKESVIFDIHSYILIGAGFLLNIIQNGFSGVIFSLIGALSGFILYEIMARSGYLIAGQRAFGEGDSLIAAGIGAFFGWKFMLLSVILSVLVMAVFTFPYFLIHSYKEGRKKTVTALIMAFCIIVFAFLVSKFEFIKTYYGSLAFMIAVMAATLWCAKQILSDMKEEKSFCMLPFGPAMAVSFLLIMFFQNELKNLIPAYIS